MLDVGEGSAGSAEVLPTLDALMTEARSLLVASGSLGVVIVEVPGLEEVEAACGAAVYEVLRAALVEGVRGLGALGDPGRILCGSTPHAEHFVLLVAGDEEMTPGGLELLAEEITGMLSPLLAELLRPFGVAAELALGYGLVLRRPMVGGERAIRRVVDRARLMARDRSGQRVIRLRERLRDMLTEGALAVVLQPILDLRTGALRAHEALVRGPPRTGLESPSALFELAAQAQAVAELDRACCELAIDRLPDVPQGTLLFVNALPSSFNDRDLWESMIHGFPEGSRLVLEVSERAAIRGHESFQDAIRGLRSEGVRIAIDDLGAGYANLEQVLRLEPEFLKLDMSLIRGIDQSPVRRTMVESMVRVAAAMGAVIIAEGVETAGEESALAALGVPWGQGWRFGRPQVQVA